MIQTAGSEAQHNPLADEMEKHKRQNGRTKTTGTIPEFEMVVVRISHLSEGHMDEIRLRNTQLHKIEVIVVKYQCR